MSYLSQIDAAPASDKWPLVRSWMQSQPLPLYAELRKHRPVIDLGPVTLATRHSDCVNILARHDLYSVEPYVSKQGDYWMAQDDTARHWREKSIMRAVLDFESVPDLRSWSEAEAARRLEVASCTEIDLIAEITRGVPLAVVERFFGFEGASHADMFDWSYWNQMDAFWNQPFDTPQFATPDEIVSRRKAANAAMRTYLIELVQRRAIDLKAGKPGTDVVSRLLILSGSGALKFDVPLVVLNVGGLLIGAVETTSHAVANALLVLVSDSELRKEATAAAQSEDPSALDGYVFEALRFKPAFPYFFRRATKDTRLAQSSDHQTDVPEGTMVLAVTHSAMFDPAACEAPESFNPNRDLRGSFTFGYGIHECLGRAIGTALIPAIARAILRRDKAQPGYIDYRKGPVPESWPWSVT
ncbi:cytochrome P450 [Rhodobium gokarnense]|uniref:Cytochrome P450 n=1 Tax=Rhodobium gokarnense TaxID=364296 RepID=A0ABT3H8I7_9HYPH|nr:cytochrome P450 [Rhodobium gokarnense]MCW2306710.1 cytochrome P450 [Rhodobium gokarnense]